MDVYECLKQDVFHHQQLKANLTRDLGSFECLRMFKVKCTQLPQRSRHYVGVPMFWPDWQDQKMRQHQNHFRALGSSPPRLGEGSIQIEQRMVYL